MRVLVAALMVVVFAGEVCGQKKDVNLAAKIAKEGTRVGDVFITATGKENVLKGVTAELSTLDLTLSLVAAVDDRRIAFTSWNEEGTASLTDNLGNDYIHIKDRELLAAIRQSRGIRDVTMAALYADRHTTTHLMFERPVPKAKRLTLEATGENVEQKGRFKLYLERGKNAGEWVLAKPDATKKP